MRLPSVYEKLRDLARKFRRGSTNLYVGRLRCVPIELKSVLPDLRGHNWPIKLAESVISLAMMMADDAIINVK